MFSLLIYIERKQDQKNLWEHLNTPGATSTPHLHPDHGSHLHTECSHGKKPSAEGEVGPEEEDKDGGGDEQEQANTQGLDLD